MIDDPTLRVTDLAKTERVTPSWVTRILRLAFLDPMIVDLVLSGKSPADLTPQALRSEDSVSALWADQRAVHRVIATI